MFRWWSWRSLLKTTACKWQILDCFNIHIKTAPQQHLISNFKQGFKGREFNYKGRPGFNSKRCPTSTILPFPPQCIKLSKSTKNFQRLFWPKSFENWVPTASDQLPQCLLQSLCCELANINTVQPSRKKCILLLVLMFMAFADPDAHMRGCHPGYYYGCILMLCSYISKFECHQDLH